METFFLTKILLLPHAVKLITWPGSEKVLDIFVQLSPLESDVAFFPWELSTCFLQELHSGIRRTDSFINTSIIISQLLWKDSNWFQTQKQLQRGHGHCSCIFRARKVDWLDGTPGCLPWTLHKAFHDPCIRKGEYQRPSAEAAGFLIDLSVCQPEPSHLVIAVVDDAAFDKLAILLAVALHAVVRVRLVCDQDINRGQQEVIYHVSNLQRQLQKKRLTPVLPSILTTTTTVRRGQIASCDGIKFYLHLSKSRCWWCRFPYALCHSMLLAPNRWSDWLYLKQTVRGRSGGCDLLSTSWR